MEIITEINRTFSSFRAENLGTELFSYYTQPNYFPKLENRIPCIIQGGRGTGKTTVLKSLSYEGQYKLHSENIKEFDKKQYIGIYFKLETALVSAFSEAGKSDEFWKNQFSDFINTQISKQICDFTIWYIEKSNNKFTFNAEKFQLFNLAIGIKNCQSLQEIRFELEKKIAKIEFNVNYASDIDDKRKTIIGSPIRRIITAINESIKLDKKTFFILLDEYENLRKYQQTVINTLIKQADIELSLKIGVREMGLKTKHTLNEEEKLVDPADYVLIDISNGLKDKEFDAFASNVLSNRFKELRNKFHNIPESPQEMFESLSEEEEIEMLSGTNKISELIATLKIKTTKSEREELLKLTKRDIALIKYLSNENENGNSEIIKEAISNSEAWKNKLNNYSHAVLYTIRRRKVGITKYYCGWKTLVLLSSKNIRYLMQLVINSLIEHTKDNKDFNTKISPQCQTNVAIETGKKNLMELEGLSTQGAQLMKLVLGLGQIFHEMAVNSENHAPEITQFEIQSDSLDKNNEVNELLRNSVMHLALLRNPGTKLTSGADTKDFDYMVHPIYSPFFVYSYRKKRKITLTADDIIGIINSPNKTIKRILLKHNRPDALDISEQLKLFGAFYDGTT